MPEIGRIQSTNFQSLLTELGITRANIPFALRSEVTPVVLVGGTVSFLASPTPAYRVQDIFTAGVQTNPASGFILADTGPLLIGLYSIQVVLVALEVNEFVFEFRNAANAANLWTQLIGNDADRVTLIFTTRLEVQNDNERFRFLTNAASTVAIKYQATILART